jgi:two-component system LytT family response regulator
MTGAIPIRTLIVDNEPLACDKIRRIAARHPEIQVVGVCASGREAAAMIRLLTPELLFLDLQMSEMDDLVALQEVAEEWLPAIVFMTAYDLEAVRAFARHGANYLLKPFDRERLEAALGRARAQLYDHSNGVSGRVRALLADLVARALGQPPVEDTRERAMPAEPGQSAWFEPSVSLRRIYARS